ncbi:MAG: 50S ribosomal protein L10 [Planctomycetota bacterium]
MRTREYKIREVEELHRKLSGANSVVLVDYRGLTVADANELRSRLRAVGEGQIEYRVAKNTLLKRAAAGTAAEGISAHLAGPTAVALSYDEPASLAKVLVDYAKEHESFEIKAGLVEGELFDLEQIRRLAELPSKDQLRGMLAGTLQAPLRNLAGTLYALLGHLRNALEQRQQKLEAS